MRICKQHEKARLAKGLCPRKAPGETVQEIPVNLEAGIEGGRVVNIDRGPGGGYSISHGPAVV